MMYFEDIDLDMSARSESTFTFTKEEIISFASEWDPMPFHIDEEVAKTYPIGKLFATSIHTIAASIKLAHTINLDLFAAVAGLGWQDVKFHKPTLVGDIVYVHSEVVDKRDSNSHPDKGIVTTKTLVINQDDEVLTEYKIITLVLKNPEKH